MSGDAGGDDADAALGPFEHASQQPFAGHRPANDILALFLLRVFEIVEIHRDGVFEDSDSLIETDPIFGFVLFCSFRIPTEFDWFWY